MAICCIIFNIYRTVEVNNILEKLLGNPDQYSNFETLSYWEMVFNSTLAIMVFFAWVKVGHFTRCHVKRFWIFRIYTQTQHYATCRQVSVITSHKAGGKNNAKKSGLVAIIGHISVFY